ncbi:MAG TPA: tRNA-binding protein [Candidatus Kapabacteria bacterium]|nr:tRNA-binding protein [Candidatus Kapabacteria bacterium]
MRSKTEITYDDFSKIDIRIGKIISAEHFPEAKKPAYKLTIDFGAEIGVKHSSAQITVNYSLASLFGKHVAAVINFPPKQIASFISEVLVLGAADNSGDIVLLEPDTPVPLGEHIY